ncbi:hypothetical protein C8R46DRAFT_1116639 [Mycena filopes]|nr:hypothetical protein C8R46DRAFT_1116639 [Mycena filopes]
MSSSLCSIASCSPELDAASPKTRRHILLNSNEAPLEAEAAVIEAELTTLDDRLLYLDNEIPRLRGRGLGKLERLEEERASVLKHRAQSRSTLSPLRRVPPEILGYIFSLTLPGPQETLQFTVVHVKESPWSLSHVSRYWRGVALSDTSLWSLVALSYNGPVSIYPLPMAETQVARAKKLKVHFYGCEKSTPQVQIETFRCLAQHAAQWEELSLGLTSHIAPLLGMLRDRLPLLRRFFLQWEGEDERAIDRVDCFQNAPSLVGAWVNDFPSVPVLFPAHNLTRYQLQASWGTHAGILQQTLNLLEARIMVNFDDLPLLDGHEIIDLTSLRRLLVSPAEILQFLRLPVLEELTIDCDVDEGPKILGAIRSAVSRSSCVLQRLCFWGIPLLTSITEILSQFPSILAFAVLISTPDDNGLARALMKRLTRTATSTTGAVAPQLAPQLRDISFACDKGAVLVHRDYLEMIASRRAGGFQRSELLVASGPRPDAVELREMETLREDGLELVYIEGEDADDAINHWTLDAQWN